MYGRTIQYAGNRVFVPGQEREDISTAELEQLEQDETYQGLAEVRYLAERLESDIEGDDLANASGAYDELFEAVAERDAPLHAMVEQYVDAWLADHRDQGEAATDGGRPQLYVGDHVQDREADDERTMVVVATPAEQADEYVVDGEDELEATVAEYNEDYPADDTVVEITYPQRTATDLNDGQRYAFPRSRLQLVDSVHDVEEADA